ncbi:MAG: hypothetical protein U5K79_07375 [Cyclobacteriaceae bacterium]|nr:hypothetical protein [Cyclobacteriaceae bacterium]
MSLSERSFFDGIGQSKNDVWKLLKNSDGEVQIIGGEKQIIDYYTSPCIPIIFSTSSLNPSRQSISDNGDASMGPGALERVPNSSQIEFVLLPSNNHDRVAEYLIGKTLKIMNPRR